MFESEMQSHDISMEFTVESSYLQEGIDWVLCDPVRLTQIFINLLTNVSSTGAPLKIPLMSTGNQIHSDRT